MYDLVGVAHVYCCGLFLLFDPLLSLGQSETAVLESSLQQTSLSRLQIGNNCAGLIKFYKMQQHIISESRGRMEGYSNSYQNGTSARETEFQRLATNVGTNVQKILQNGENSIIDFSVHNT